MQTTRFGWKASLRGAGALFLVGMVGVVALAVQTLPTLRDTPGLEGLSDPLLLVVAGVNSALLLLVFSVLGAFAAPRVGLRSNVFQRATNTGPDWRALSESLPRAAALGVGLFFVTVVLDLLFAPFLTIEAGPTTATAAESLRGLYRSVPMRLLYGGITEEILLRWGVMAPVAWVVHRVRSRGGVAGTPAASTMWVAIVVSAVLFGVGHLPALASAYGLTPLLVVRTVLLNAVVGVGFGWLFWRDSLETAMVAHACFHVALVAVSTVVILL